MPLPYNGEPVVDHVLTLQHPRLKFLLADHGRSERLPNIIVGKSLLIFGSPASFAAAAQKKKGLIKKMIAYRYDDNKKYAGTQNCQRDPIASVRTGKDVFLLPANCTYEKPPELKDGYELYFKNGAWEYVEKKKDDEEVKEPELTPEQKLEQELSALDREYETSKKELSLAYVDAMMSGDAELQDSLKAELAALNETYDSKRTELENESEE